MTDGAIGAYTAATVLACLGAVGVAEEALAKGWWITLLVGLGFGALAAVTGLADWLTIMRRTPLWRTTTTHMLVMVLATLLFAAAAIVGYAGYDDGEVGAGALVLVLCGFVALTAGGWLGGAIVFVHGCGSSAFPTSPRSGLSHRAARRRSSPKPSRRSPSRDVFRARRLGKLQRERKLWPLSGGKTRDEH